MALGYDGSIRIDTKINSKGFNTGLSSMSASLKGFAKSVLIAFATTQLVQFGRASIKAASDLASAWTGLNSIIEGQGGSFAKAQTFIEGYIKDGLIPLGNAVTAYKNLSMRGYDSTQIEQTMTALKDSAAFGRQASLSMGEAVQSATEGLKNENSILVDNAGVTKNVSVMWKEYADSIGVGVQSLTKAQRIEAENIGILRETRFQVGDAAKLTGTYAGQVSMLSFHFSQLKVAIGNALIPIAKAVLPGIHAIISALTLLANVFAQVTTLLFGGELKKQEDTQKGIASSGGAAAGAVDDLAGATMGAGNASKKAAKDMKGVLTSFDELNVLASNAADSVGSAAGDMGAAAGGLDIAGATGGGTLFGEVEVSPEVIAFIDRLREALIPTRVALSELWTELQKVGSFAWDGLKGFYELFLKPIGEWALGEDGIPRLARLFSDTLASIDWEALNKSFAGLWEQLSKMTTFVGDSLIDFYELFLKPIAEWTMNEAIPRLVDALTDGLALVDWEAIRGGLDALWVALEPFAENVGDGLLWFWENVLVPIGTWVMNKIVPVFLEMLALALDAVNVAIDILKPYAEWLFENFLKPLAAFTGGLIVWALESIVSALKGVSDWIAENEGVIQAATITVLAFFSALSAIQVAEFLIKVGGIPGILQLVHDGFDRVTIKIYECVAAWGAHLIAVGKGKIETMRIIGLYAKDFVIALATSITTLAKDTAAWVTSTAAKLANAVAQGAMTAATVVWNGICAVAAAVTTAFGVAVAFLASPIGIVILIIGALIALVVLLVKHWDEVKAAAALAWAAIVEAWETAGEWFRTNVTEPIQRFFSEMWDGIKTKASEILASIQELWKTVSAWFHETVITPVSDFFKSLWDNISTWAAGAWKSITDTFSKAKAWFDTNVIVPITKAFNGFINGLIGYVESFANFFIGGINGIIGAINGMIQAAANALAMVGIEIGFAPQIPSIPTIQLPRLPALAQGAVIPPNQQFAAILGDQRSGVNIETPLSTMVQAFKMALSDGGYGGGDTTVTMPVYLDSREIYRGQQTVSRQKGTNLVRGLL